MVDYEIRYSNRRTLAVYVYRDLRVEVRAPHDCPPAVLQGFVDERADWIRRKQEAFARLPIRSSQIFSAGSRHPYLGSFYPLVLTFARPHGTWFAEDRLLVRARDEADVPRVLAGWYRRQAEAVLPERFDACRRAVERFRLPEARLRLRHMRSRWGSCSAAATITLNIDLVRYPLRLIDYVIFHELCHLREFHHGPAFYRLMDAMMPDWQQHRAELRRLAREMPPWPNPGG